MTKQTSELIGQLFINESKDGKTKYLRGHVNGAEIVAFISKDNKSYHVLPDTRKEGGTEKKTFNKGGYKKPYNSAPRPSTSSDDAPF